MKPINVCRLLTVKGQTTWWFGWGTERSLRPRVSPGSPFSLSFTHLSTAASPQQYDIITFIYLLFFIKLETTFWAGLCCQSCRYRVFRIQIKNCGFKGSRVRVCLQTAAPQSTAALQRSTCITCITCFPIRRANQIPAVTLVLSLGHFCPLKKSSAIKNVFLLIKWSENKLFSTMLCMIGISLK